MSSQVSLIWTQSSRTIYIYIYSMIMTFPLLLPIMMIHTHTKHFFVAGRLASINQRNLVTKALIKAEQTLQQQ